MWNFKIECRAIYFSHFFSEYFECILRWSQYLFAVSISNLWVWRERTKRLWISNVCASHCTLSVELGSVFILKWFPGNKINGFVCSLNYKISSSCKRFSYARIHSLLEFQCSSSPSVSQRHSTSMPDQIKYDAIWLLHMNLFHAKKWTLSN